MSHLVRFADGAGDIRVGLLAGEQLRPLAVTSMSELLRHSVAEIRELTDTAGEPVATAGVRLLPPLDGRMEVWAAGVTYLRSEEARREESADEDVYARVYRAQRPELFFKSAAWRVVTDGEPIAIRADSANNVPEPELGLLLTSAGEIAGYVVVDDVSSRSIEGENPLYLPQAKIYTGSCAVSARVRPAWEVPDPLSLDLRMRILRDDHEVFDGESSTAQLNRKPAGLVEYLWRDNDFPDGAVLSTGTSVVPGLDQGLQPGDVVEIEIGEVGSLRTPVVLGADEVRGVLAAR
ncbi:fumarylacetoacetate (FAA) hydrolase [Amycolatopsis mediterranei S699]|uniref:Fumarylacetoacetate (FAA) hydrolase n=2 Tax=Amycolatopsis mediterranei TaxID=33910 RepID=A0A0H3DE76_AMYMU|nr:fumarylacetoacetate hydrolase family protein [Amycolatopsis mediterranei]ADJ47929.1 fumarylacetoacetate (FAA) hydrolase [Amycolatopsis mediterranei U32]AEK44828.1 fumarylacetoacetate (FAA) hydrolase [Amycolatopsis mediterranei S699]AFO79640.1 fumarylacetoacetate (FAA) hydrolase [Amycolatopsis mediterranei S699]AGT86768.1 fumarylacetoacetate (FAA) hydrolase [Amycolatopsis mediterranei RB]KDO10750.1 fumarylacetoacetate hydrolase [Amycolatopsis mediterranei]